MSGRRIRLLIAGGVLISLFGAAALGRATRDMGVASYLPGPGIRWQEAYRALGASESGLPRDARARERLLLAWAQVEDEPPPGLGARLHRPGTLATLRYETFDARDEPRDTWEVRALVPPLPFFVALGAAGPVRTALGCPARCRAALARNHGVLLQHAGQAGIAAEWVLRMPVGRAFDLPPRSLVTQDILAESPRHLGLTSGRDGTRTVVEPARIRLTLLEACPAEVRVGTVWSLDFDQTAIIAIPRGLTRLRWVQLDGCPSLAAAGASDAGSGGPAVRE